MGEQSIGEHPPRNGAAIGGGSGMSLKTGAGSRGGGGGESGGEGRRFWEPKSASRGSCFCFMWTGMTRGPLADGGEDGGEGKVDSSDGTHCKDTRHERILHKLDP